MKLNLHNPTFCFSLQTQVRRDEPEQLVHVADREAVATRGDVDGTDVQRSLRDSDRKRPSAGSHRKTSRTRASLQTRKPE
jgi:hypothetical protein